MKNKPNVTPEMIIQVKEKIFKNYKSISEFCTQKKLKYAYTNNLLNNPEKISQKFWVRLKNLVG